MILSENDRILKEWISKKGPYYVDKPGEELNNKLIIRVRFLMKQQRQAVIKFSLLRYIFSDQCERAENKAMYYGSIRNCWTVMGSLAKQREYYNVLASRLQESKITHKKLYQAILADIKQGEDRVTRLESSLIQEYMEQAGLKQYLEFLEENNRSFNCEIAAYYAGIYDDQYFVNNNEEGDAEVDKNKMYDAYHHGYLQKIHDELVENGIEIIDMTDRLTKYQERREQLKAEKKQKEQDERMEMLKNTCDHTLMNLLSTTKRAFDRGYALKKEEWATSTRAVQRISVIASEKGIYKIYILVGAQCVTRGSHPGLMLYNEDNTWKRSKVTGNAKIFREDQMAEMEEIIKKAKEEANPKGYARFEILNLDRDQDSTSKIIISDNYIRTNDPDKLKQIDTEMDEFMKSVADTLFYALEDDKKDLSDSPLHIKDAKLPYSGSNMIPSEMYSHMRMQYTRETRMTKKRIAAMEAGIIPANTAYVYPVVLISEDLAWFNDTMANSITFKDHLGYFKNTKSSYAEKTVLYSIRTVREYTLNQLTSLNNCSEFSQYLMKPGGYTSFSYSIDDDQRIIFTITYELRKMMLLLDKFQKIGEILNESGRDGYHLFKVGVLFIGYSNNALQTVDFLHIKSELIDQLKEVL